MNPLSVFFIILMSPPDALAYIDPGSGMLVWQGLIAAVGAVLIFVRHPIQTIKSWIERLKRK